MRRLIPLIACLLLSLTLRAQQAQTKTQFEAYCASFFPEVRALSTQKEYRQLLSRYAEWEQKYEVLAPADRQAFIGLLANVNYNRACFYALLHDKPNALLSFRRAISNGYKDYANAKVDTDLDLIRGDKEFQRLLASIREHGDYIYVLQQAKGYAAARYRK